MRKVNITVFGHALRVLGKALERTTHKLEGCWCHPHVWMVVGKSYKRKVECLYKETGRKLCVWKTRMSPWFVAEGLEQLFKDIMTCSTPELDSLISDMPAALRSVLVDVIGVLRRKLVEELKDKLGFWFETPYKAVGGFWVLHWR